MMPFNCSRPAAAKIVLWMLRILTAALFVFGSFMKLTDSPMTIAEFAVIGLGQWFRYLTGFLELVGSVAILVPVISALGATLLLLVDAGAFFAQLFVLHGDLIHTVVIAVILLAIIYLRRVCEPLPKSLKTGLGVSL
jgi:putative oxidoreductase